MNLRSLESVDIGGKRVAIRVDFNVPMSGTRIDNDQRIRACVPTINQCLNRRAEVVLLSHLGRPKGRLNPDLSLDPVASHLSKLLDQHVDLVSERTDFLDSGSTATVRPGRVSLLENLRFEAGEEQNDPELARDLASIGDVYVMDAFGTAHRAHASTFGAIEFSAIACAGPLLLEEVNSIRRVMDSPKRPLVAVVGGAKISGKLEVLIRLADLADCILVGGGMANTFLLAQGYPTGKSLVEPDLAETAKSIASATDVPLPSDLMTCKSVEQSSNATLRLLHEVCNDDVIVDIGPSTARKFALRLRDAGTILWNGPMGVFELDQFGEGTRIVAEAIANSNAYTLGGGGDTISALERNGLRSKIDYVSTGGGAFLNLVEGRKLPSLAALERHFSEHPQV